MTRQQIGLAAIDGLLFVLLVLRLAILKRAIDRYRPPSPLPRTMRYSWEALTVMRVT